MERNTYNTMMFQIGIPTLNRADLLISSLSFYAKQDFPDTQIHVVDNGNQMFPEYPDNVEIIRNEKNVGVGASWNMLCEKIFQKSDYALILNDDIYLGKSTQYINNIINKYPTHFLTATPDWCAFIIPKRIWQSVGKFDECFFPAYYEDNSYAYRMKLAGKIHIKTPLLNPFVYKSSQTLEKDLTILDARIKNKELYIKMWGGEPMKEKYTTPYGNRD